MFVSLKYFVRVEVSCSDSLFPFHLVSIYVVVFLYQFLGSFSRISNLSWVNILLRIRYSKLK